MNKLLNPKNRHDAHFSPGSLEDYFEIVKKGESYSMNYSEFYGTDKALKPTCKVLIDWMVEKLIYGNYPSNNQNYYLEFNKKTGYVSIKFQHIIGFYRLFKLEVN